MEEYDFAYNHTNVRFNLKWNYANLRIFRHPTENSKFSSIYNE